MPTELAVNFFHSGTRQRQAGTILQLMNIDGATHIVRNGTPIDVGSLPGGEAHRDITTIYDHWADFVAWCEGLDDSAPVSEAHAVNVLRVGAPSPTPRQVFGIGLNYRSHAEEAGFDVPDDPVVFTKYPTCITGPEETVALPREGDVDWEIELVVVIGSLAERVSPEQAWRHVAGVTVGQDLTDRRRQHRGPAPQFSLSKSLPGFGPTGPVLVTPDELPDPDNLVLRTTLNGEEVQTGTTSDMGFSVADLIERLSHVVPLTPGDLIFTGTPPGIGMAMSPPRYLKPGDDLVSSIEGVGTLHTTFAEELA